MGLFGLFGKKDNPPAQPDREGARPKTDTVPDAGLRRQRSARANDTERKIDAIESEMSSEFVPSRTMDSNTGQPAAGGPATLPDLDHSTDLLLGVEDQAASIAVGSSEAAPALQEAAILYADEQYEVAEQMLRMAIEEMKDSADQEAWLMLFDLYQATGRQQDFDSLSMDYATRFERSPPSWRQQEAEPVQARSVIPSVAFAGALDGNIIKSLERAQKLAEQGNALRLDFSRVTEVAPVGCGLLLRTLKRLEERELILSGAAELAVRIRSILEVGRRDETEAPWLLLLEILRLQNREQEFEDTSIDYCITFEVSPPPFVPPRASAARPAPEAPMEERSFTLPAVVEGRIETLLGAIARHAALHDPLVLDCQRLKRIDFTAAGQLLMCLSPLARNGMTIELRNVSRLVMALFAMIGLNEIARILPRKT